MKKRSLLIYLVVAIVITYNIYLIRGHTKLENDLRYLRSTISENIQKEPAKSFDFEKIADLDSIDKLYSIRYSDDTVNLDFKIGDNTEVEKIANDVIDKTGVDLYSQVVHEYKNDLGTYDMTAILYYGGTNE